MSHNAQGEEVTTAGGFGFSFILTEKELHYSKNHIPLCKPG